MLQANYEVILDAMYAPHNLSNHLEKNTLYTLYVLPDGDLVSRINSLSTSVSSVLKDDEGAPRLYF